MHALPLLVNWYFVYVYSHFSLFSLISLLLLLTHILTGTHSLLSENECPIHICWQCQGLLVPWSHGYYKISTKGTKSIEAAIDSGLAILLCSVTMVTELHFNSSWPSVSVLLNSHSLFKVPDRLLLAPPNMVRVVGVCGGDWRGGGWSWGVAGDFGNGCQMSAIAMQWELPLKISIDT